MDTAEGQVSALWPVALRDGKYQLCPYLLSRRPHQCILFRAGGWHTCFRCGFNEGLEVGYDYGNNDGREEQYHTDRMMQEANR